MKKIIFAASIFFAASCSTENVEIEKTGSIEIVQASASLIGNTGAFLSKINSNSRVKDAKFNLSDFEPSKLNEVVVSDGEKSGSAYGIISKTNPEIGLLVSFDELGNVKGSLYTENVVVSEGVIDTKLYDMDGNLRIYFTSTNSEVVFHDVPTVNGRTVGWFSDTGDCISDAAQPFDNGLLNLAFDYAATAVTGGWYPAVLVAACSIISI